MNTQIFFSSSFGAFVVKIGTSAARAAGGAVRLGAVGALALTLSACETFQGRGDKELIGGGSGAIIGGVLGSQVGSGSGRLWATGAGALLGLLAGSEIGRSLDRADAAYLERANYQAQSAPVGQTIQWNNPESGNYGAVTPVRDGYDEANRYCREFEQVIYVDGVQETGIGRACRRQDGKWEVVS